MAGITMTLLVGLCTTPEIISDYYTKDEAIHLMQEEGYNQYNQGYKKGMLYAYDNVLICGASPEAEGMRLAKLLGKPSEVSDIVCSE